MRSNFLYTILVLSILNTASHAAETVFLGEKMQAGLKYTVDTRVKLSGELILPAEGDQPAKTVKMIGESAIQYDERILPVDQKTNDPKTLRLYRRMDFSRTIGDRLQEMSLRKEVRRLVIVKSNQGKKAFSPDAPLTFGEIDLLRTDVFLPSLTGLLPNRNVRVGDFWQVTNATTAELTDLETIDSGRLDAKLEEIIMIGGRSVAHVKLVGDLKGVNEDGPTRQKLSGTLYFDLEGKFIAYLSINGEHLLLDKDGKQVGKNEGRYVLTRQIQSSLSGLSDEVVNQLVLEPNEKNTQLFYENVDLGIQFLHPRSWRINAVRGRQITVDEANGNGLLITVDPPERIPTAEQFFKESQDVLQQRKIKILRQEKPTRGKSSWGELDSFRFLLEASRQQVSMDYYILRQPLGGATFAARILETDQTNTQKEVLEIAKTFKVVQPLSK